MLIGEKGILLFIFTPHNNGSICFQNPMHMCNCYYVIPVRNFCLNNVNSEVFIVFVFYV